MTDLKSHHSGSGTATPTADPTVQEYPKQLYRDVEDTEPEPKVEGRLVKDKKEEQEARGEGFLDGAEIQKKHATPKPKK